MDAVCPVWICKYSQCRRQVALASFSSDRRKPAGRNDRRTAEVSRNLKGALEQAVLLELAPRSQVRVVCASHSFDADSTGSLRCCVSLEPISTTESAAGR